MGKWTTRQQNWWDRGWQGSQWRKSGKGAGGGRSRSSASDNAYKYCANECGNWTWTNRKHKACNLCGLPWDAVAADPAYTPEKYKDTKKEAATPNAEHIQKMVEALGQALKADISTMLAAVLPQPKAVEEKAATESQAFAAMRSARAALAKARSQRATLQKTVTRHQTELSAAQKKLAEAEATEKEAEKSNEEERNKYFVGFPASAKEANEKLDEIMLAAAAPPQLHSDRGQKRPAIVAPDTAAAAAPRGVGGRYHGGSRGRPAATATSRAT